MYSAVAFANMTILRNAIPEGEESPRNICTGCQVIIPTFAALVGIRFYYLNRKSELSVGADTSLRY